jgi:Na+/melibiose symporter-like transporter
LAAVGNIFILNTPSKVALNWFSSDRVPIVTFTGILATLISLTIGASIPGFLIDEDSTPDQIKEFLLIEACVVTIPYIFLMIFFREKPEFAPSKAAKATNNKEREKYKSLLKKLFSNKQYLKLMVAMTLNYGTLTALLMVLDQTLKGIGYTDSGEKTSITIVSAMLLGILSNPIFSFLLRSTKAYKAVSMLSNN